MLLLKNTGNSLFTVRLQISMFSAIFNNGEITPR